MEIKRYRITITVLQKSISSVRLSKNCYTKNWDVAALQYSKKRERLATQTYAGLHEKRAVELLIVLALNEDQK